MHEIDIHELKDYSPWIERLEVFQRGARTEADVFREYDSEKYKNLLDVSTMRDALNIPRQEVCYSRHGHLYVGSGEEVQAEYEHLFKESLDLSGVNTVIELGGGFGYHTSLLQQKYPNKQYLVGEFSPNARTVGERVTSGIQFAPFNFYSDWNIFDRVGNALVFTVHAVEMLENARLFLDEIEKRKNKISSVVLYEPLYAPGDDQLSILRRKYIEAHRYNKNLIDHVPSTAIETDFFGFNPLFPVSRITLL